MSAPVTTPETQPVPPNQNPTGLKAYAGLLPLVFVVAVVGYIMYASNSKT